MKVIRITQILSATSLASKLLANIKYLCWGVFHTFGLATIWARFWLVIAVVRCLGSCLSYGASLVSSNCTPRTRVKNIKTLCLLVDILKHINLTPSRIVVVWHRPESWPCSTNIDWHMTNIGNNKAMSILLLSLDPNASTSSVQRWLNSRKWCCVIDTHIVALLRSIILDQTPDFGRDLALIIDETQGWIVDLESTISKAYSTNSVIRERTVMKSQLLKKLSPE